MFKSSVQEQVYERRLLVLLDLGFCFEVDFGMRSMPYFTTWLVPQVRVQGSKLETERSTGLNQQTVSREGFGL